MKETTEKEVWNGTRLSPSSMITYYKCPREFYYKYVLRLPQKPSIHLIKGTIVHKVLEILFKRQYRADMFVATEEIFDKEWTSNKEKLEELLLETDELELERRDCLNILDLYIRGVMQKIDDLVMAKKAENGRHAFHLIKPKFRELWIENKDLRLCGYIDRVHTDFDGIVTLGDYKTSKRYGIGIKEDYELQCALYGLLYYNEYSKLPDYTSIIFLRYGEEVRTPCTPNQIRLAQDKVEYVHSKTTTDDINDYPLRENKLCKWCDFLDKCSGQDAVKEKNKIKRLTEEMSKIKEAE